LPGDIIECTFTNEPVGTTEICIPPEIPDGAGGCFDPTVCTSPEIPDGAGGCFDPTVCTSPAVLVGDECVLSTGKQGLKLTVIEDLTALKGTDDKTDKKIDNAIKHIRHSLEGKLWDGDSTLDAKKGKKVFDEEARAVKELKKILKKADDPPAGIETAITDLVNIDRMLARDAINSVPTDPPNAKVDKELEKANKEMDKAEDELTKTHQDHAIKKFKKAWEHAQHALKKL